MQLQSLLEVTHSSVPIQVDLYNEKSLLLIRFELPGYDCLDDFILDDTIQKIEFTYSSKIINKMNIQIDTSHDDPHPTPTGDGYWPTFVGDALCFYDGIKPSIEDLEIIFNSGD